MLFVIIKKLFLYRLCLNVILTIKLGFVASINHQNFGTYIFHIVSRGQHNIVSAISLIELPRSLKQFEELTNYRLFRVM